MTTDAFLFVMIGALISGLFVSAILTMIWSTYERVLEIERMVRKQMERNEQE
jgi:hypothetical protein